MLDQLTDMENVLPILETQPRKKLTKVNQVPMVVIKGKWTSETLKEAMDVVEKRTCSLQRPTSHGTCL
jgi:uncharacterized OsmC-like protein